MDVSVEMHVVPTKPDATTMVGGWQSTCAPRKVRDMPDESLVAWNSVQIPLGTLGNHALSKHWPDSVGEPRAQFDTPLRILDGLDAEADFCEASRADVQLFKRLRGDKRHHASVRLRSAELGEDVGVEQVAVHSVTSRTGIASPLGARSSSR